MKFGCPQTFVSQIWRRFVLILLVTQIIAITVFFLVSAAHVGTRLGANASALLRIVDIVFSQGNPVLIRQVSEVLDKDAYFKLISGRVKNTSNQLPHYPALLAAAKTIDQLWQEKVSISYQADPIPMIWVQKNQPPLFALGVPFVGSQFMQRFSLVILFILFFAVIFMAWWVAKRISKPLLKLAEDAVQMGKGQKINHITPDPHSCTEIIALTDSLNKMRADINRMIKEREDFLAEISHDLRTPLSRLRMGVEMLKPDSSKFIEGLKEDIDEINIILKQAIDLECSDIDANESWVQGDINQLLSDVQKKYQRAGVSLKLDLADMPRFRFKTLALTRLLYNLIDNGMQHNGEGQVQVILSSRMDCDIPAIIVVNTGIDGGAKAVSGSAQSLTARKISSSNGLGLLIVQRIAEMHGATVKSSETACKCGREVVISFAAT
jgi:signal transduction histidine kinase